MTLMWLSDKNQVDFDTHYDPVTLQSNISDNIHTLQASIVIWHQAISTCVFSQYAFTPCQLFIP